MEIQIYDPDYDLLPGAEVLKLSTKEYFRRFEDGKKRSLETIKYLNNRIYKLEEELLIKQKAFRLEKEEAITDVRNFWKNILEGNTRSGKLVQAASRTVK